MSYPTETIERLQAEVNRLTEQDRAHAAQVVELMRERDGLSMLLLEAAAERDRLSTLVNTPEMEDFLKGVRLEAAHQIERWGPAHDRSKSAEAWFWLVGYLAGKALRSAIEGNREKALHHCISSAAALFNWHRAIQTDTTGHGIGADADLNPEPNVDVLKR